MKYRAKQLNIVVNSRAGSSLTPQERLNYMSCVEYCDNSTTEWILERFREEVNFYILNDRMVESPFNLAQAA